MTVAVVTDTCASIPTSVAEELDLEVVAYYIHHANGTWRDSVDITPQEFYEWLPQAQELPTTANPGPGDYLKAFENAANKGHTEILSVHLSSQVSGAYQAGLIARDMTLARRPDLRIEIVDTRQVSMVHGWATIEAARAARSGADLAQATQIARHVADAGWMFMAADTLKYLYMGGRIGRAKHLVGSLLNVKPIFSMSKEGIITGIAQARSMQQAYAKIVELMNESGDANRPLKVCITHNAADERAEALLGAISDAYQVEEVLVTQLSPALGVHTGPGMVGVCFFPVQTS